MKTKSTNSAKILVISASISGSLSWGSALTFETLFLRFLFGCALIKWLVFLGALLLERNKLCWCFAISSFIALS